MKKWIYNVLFILCVVVVVYAVLKIYNQKEEYKKAETEYEQLQKKEKNIDFGELKKLNKDIVAWIKIPGTRINYPIVQGSDDEEYLHRTFLKKRNSSGAIFLEVKCKKDFTSENNIIYGHHMRNGTMFADLVKLRDQRFVKKHDLIQLYLPEKTIDLTIVSAYAGKVQKIPITFKSKEAKEKWEDEIKNRSEIISRKKLEGRIYTFVTCSYERENNRTYVYAIERKITK